MGERILVIEDDESLARLVRLQLERAGYQVTICLDGLSGLREARRLEPDLILLDILLPEMSGWTVCEHLREITDASIIFTTALTAERDMVQGLDLGADDYITKPFSDRELLARVRAALRRSRPAASQEATYERGGLYVNLKTRDVSVNGDPVVLTPLEYELLAALVQEAGRAISHTRLLRRVWGPQHEGRRDYLKLYIWYLRRKIEADPARPEFILTERGVGYRLAAPQGTL